MSEHDEDEMDTDESIDLAVDARRYRIWKTIDWDMLQKLASGNSSDEEDDESGQDEDNDEENEEEGEQTDADSDESEIESDQKVVAMGMSQIKISVCGIQPKDFSAL